MVVVDGPLVCQRFPARTQTVLLPCDVFGVRHVIRMAAVAVCKWPTAPFAHAPAAGHAAGAYPVPHVESEAKTLYPNNIPCGAMRGFGVSQATFAMESCIDELCEKGHFDPWQFRYDNALVNGSMTATGQILHEGVGVRETLLAVKKEYDKEIWS